MNTYNSLNDIRRHISDIPLCCPELYINHDELCEEVSYDYLNLLKSRGWNYGKKLPEISDEEFWSLFKTYERNVRGGLT